MGRRGAEEQGYAPPPPRTGFHRYGEPAGRGLCCGQREGKRVERAEVDGGSHGMERAWRRQPEPRRKYLTSPCLEDVKNKEPVRARLRLCLVFFKKKIKILYHIKSLNICIKY